jgi:hypothetical protein
VKHRRGIGLFLKLSSQTFYSDRVKAVQKLAGRVVDPENGMLLVRHSDFSSDKQKVAALFAIDVESVAAARFPTIATITPKEGRRPTPCWGARQSFFHSNSFAA